MAFWLKGIDAVFSLGKVFLDSREEASDPTEAQIEHHQRPHVCPFCHALYSLACVLHCLSSASELIVMYRRSAFLWEAAPALLSRKGYATSIRRDCLALSLWLLREAHTAGDQTIRTPASKRQPVTAVSATATDGKGNETSAPAGIHASSSATPAGQKSAGPPGAPQMSSGGDIRDDTRSVSLDQRTREAAVRAAAATATSACSSPEVEESAHLVLVSLRLSKLATGQVRAFRHEHPRLRRGIVRAKGAVAACVAETCQLLSRK